VKQPAAKYLIFESPPPPILKAGTVILILAFSSLVNTGAITLAIPWLATTIAFVTVLLLPGFLLSGLVFSREELSWPERLPVAFVLSLGLLSLPAVALLALHTSLAILGWISVVINVVLGGLYLLRQQKHAQDSTSVQDVPHSRINGFLLAASLLSALAVVCVFLLTASTWSFGDNWSYLLYIRRYLDLPLTAAVSAIPGMEGISARGAFNSWWVLQAFVDRAAGVEPVDIYSFYLPPLLLIVSLLAFYSLAQALFQSRNAALLAMLLQVLYYFSSIGSHDWIGRGFLDRIIEDKFLIWFILLPVTLLLMLRYLSTGKRKQLLLLVLSTAALALTHPMGLVQAGISFASFALLYLLYNLKRDKILRVVVIFIPLLFFLLVPLAQRDLMATQVTGGAAFDYVGGVESQFILSQARLWIFSAVDNQYMAHPHLVAHPLTILAILLTPLLIPYLRQSLAARFLFSNMAVPLLLLYNPITAPLLGRLITPWMLWRVSWLLPVSLTLGFFWDKIIGWAQRSLAEFPFCARRPYVGQMIPILAVVLMAVPLQAYIADGLGSLRERKERTLSQYERDLLLHLREHVVPGSVIMAEPAFNDDIPAFVGDVGVLTFRSNAPPSVLEDISRFYGARLANDSIFGILRRWNARYIIIEQGHPLAFQLELLSPLFTRLYQNAGYALFEASADPGTQYAIAGNTYLMRGEWDKAVAQYERALALNPTDTLAYWGLGQVYQAQDKSQEARDAYRQALAASPDNVWARHSLAGLYAQEGQMEEAITLIQTGIQLSPDYLASFEVLGDLYRMQGKADQAFGQYAKAIESPPDTGDYHLALGDLYWTKGLSKQAIAEYQTAVAAGPHAWKVYLGQWDAIVRLAQAYLAEDELEDAIAVYQQAISSAPNFEVAYTRLGNLYLAQGFPKSARALYREASRHNPNSAWPHIELGKLYLQQGMASSGNETN
jgi:tetratricopeptide (TPR) repeat protein